MERKGTSRRARLITLLTVILGGAALLLVFGIGALAAMQYSSAGSTLTPGGKFVLSAADMTETALCIVPTDLPGGYVAMWEIFGTPTPTPEKRMAEVGLVDAMTKIAQQPGKGLVGTPITLQTATPRPDQPISAIVAGDPVRGRIIYYTAGACASCHDATNGVTIVARSLYKIGAEAEGRTPELSAAGYLRSVLANPDANVIPKTDKPGIMPPNYLTLLTPEQVNDLIAFLLTLK